MNRYPGLSPFSIDEKNIFFGRDDDVRLLYNLLQVENRVVLFSKSGIGKSSVINAGLVPLFNNPENNIQHFDIRFGTYIAGQKHTLAEIFSERIKIQLIQHKLDTCLIEKLGKSENELWNLFKSFRNEKEREIQYIFIFDQFEEIFTYPEPQIRAFKTKLAELLNNVIPKDIQTILHEKFKEDRQFLSKDEHAFLLRKINFKSLFSIRNDRMSLMDQLTDMLPNILHTRYELKMLNREQAKNAILKPAQKENTSTIQFSSPKFSYQAETVKDILDFLTNQNKTGVESFQLQVICQFAESIATNEFHSNQSIEIERAHLGDLKNLFRNQYKSLLQQFTDLNIRKQAQELIEDHLIVDGNRVSLPRAVIISQLKIPVELLSELENLRILRSEPNTLGGNSYEISHDTLLPSILEERSTRINQEIIEEEKRKVNEQLRLEKEKSERQKLESDAKRKALKKRLAVISALGLVFFFITILAISFWIDARKQKNKAEKADLESRAMLANQLINTDPTAAFHLADSLKKIHPENTAILATYLKTCFETDAFYTILYQQNDGISNIAFNQDGTQLIFYGLDSIEKVLDIKTKRISNKNAVSKKKSKYYSRDSLLYATVGGDDRMVIVWTEAGKKLKEFQHPSQVSSISFSQDCKNIVTTSGERDKNGLEYDSNVRIWNLLNGKCEILPIFHTRPVTYACFSNNGERVYSCGFDGKIKIYDLKTKALRTLLGYNEVVNKIIVSQDERYLWSCGGDFTTQDKDNTIRKWDIGEKRTKQINIGTPLDLKQWNVDDNLLQIFKEAKIRTVTSADKRYTLSYNKEHFVATLQNTKTKQTISLKGHRNAINSAIFTKDGQSIISASDDSTIRIWDLNGKTIKVFNPQQGFINSVVISPDGDNIATAGENKTVKIWSADLKLLNTFKGNTETINSVTFSPDGRFILTAAGDAKAILWTRDGRLIYEFKHSRFSNILYADFSSDGKKVYTLVWNGLTDERYLKEWTCNLY